MSIGNVGEGGVLAFMALVGEKPRKHLLLSNWSLPSIDIQGGQIYQTEQVKEKAEESTLGATQKLACIPTSIGIAGQVA